MIAQPARTPCRGPPDPRALDQPSDDFVLKAAGGKRRLSSSSLKSAFVEIIWPRRALVGIGLADPRQPLGGHGAAGVDATWSTTLGEGSSSPVPLLAAGGGDHGAGDHLLHPDADPERRGPAPHRAAGPGPAPRPAPRCGPSRTRRESCIADHERRRGRAEPRGTGLVQLVGGIVTALIALFFLLRIGGMTALALVPMALFAVVSTRPRACGPSSASAVHPGRGHRAGPRPSAGSASSRASTPSRPRTGSSRRASCASTRTSSRR